MRRASLVAGGVLGSAGLIAGITLLARLTGFGRWFVFSGTVGSTCVGEAYLTANQLPNVLFEVAAGGALASTVVPLVAGALAVGDGTAAAQVRQITSALLTWAVVVLAPLSLLLAALAGPLAGALLGGQACAGQRDLAAAMLVVFAPQVLLYGIGAVLTGVLQAHRRFFWPALAPLVSSLLVVACYGAFGASAAGAQDDPRALPAAAFWWLAGGTTAGVVVMTVAVLVPLRGTGIRLRPTLRLPPGVAVRARSLVAAGLVALAAQQASVLVVVVLANARGVTGSLTVFSYVQAMYLLPYAVLAVPLATSAFPRLSAQAAAQDRAGFAGTAARTTRAVLVVAAAGAAALAAAAPAVERVFAGIDTGSVAGLASGLTAMAPGLVGYALVAHVGRALYAVHAGRRAATATATGWLVVCAAAVALTAGPARGGDVTTGLGAATALGMSVAGVLLLRGLVREAGASALAGVTRTALVAVAAAAAGAGLGRLAADEALRLGGTGIPAALGAGLVAGCVAVAVLAAATAVLDRGVLAQLRRVAA